jgi:hypothetical protein
MQSVIDAKTDKDNCIYAVAAGSFKRRSRTRYQEMQQQKQQAAAKAVTRSTKLEAERVAAQEAVDAAECGSADATTLLNRKPCSSRFSGSLSRTRTEANEYLNQSIEAATNARHYS